MLKQGVFVDANGESHAVHIVDEDGFFRIDITTIEADFHTDLDGIEYSLVRRRRAYEYGDRRLYDMYLNFFERAHAVRGEVERTSGWVNGKYEVVVKQERKDLNYLSEVKTHNGKESSETITLGNEAVSTYVVSDTYGVKLDPINFIDYEEVSLGEKKTKETFNTPYIPMDILKARYDLKHIDAKDCLVVTTVEEAKSRFYRWLRHPSQFKGFDTETTGVDVDMYGKDQMVGIILSIDENESTYYPFRHEEFSNLPMDFLEEMMGWVIKEQEKLIAHNKKFDRKVMLKEGYDLRIKWDTMILSIILNPVIKKNSHALKTLMKELDGLFYLELHDVFVSDKLINFAKLPLDVVKYYACPDAYNVVRLFKYLWAKLPVYQQKLVILECELADLKADQEYYGMRVDVKKFARSYENTNYVIEKLVKTFRSLTRVDGNINSPNVLNELLYNKMRCPVLVRTKTNRPSTSSAAIKKLAGTKAQTPHTFTEDLKDLEGNVIVKASKLAESKYPALVILEKYREYNKRKTAFYARFERTMNTGRIFFWINQLGAESGRQSSPMHQLPPELKAVMISDYDNRYLWGPDFSQIELRMIAFLSGQKDLIELCCNPENDIHRVIGALISGKPMWAISSKERKDGKRRNFGVVYLISEYGLAGQIYGPGYTKEQVAWCKEQLDAFYRRFKYIADYLRKNRIQVEEKGFMMTKHYNRIRYFTEILSDDVSSKRKSSLIRQANNLPVQGTAADYLKVAEVNMYNYIRNKGWYRPEDGIPMVRPMLSIHDEILVSSHKSIPKEEIIEMIKVCMEVPVEGAPPFFVAPALMDNWEGHSDDSLAIPIKYRDELIAEYNETGKTVFKSSYYKLNISKDTLEILSENKHVPVYARAKLAKDSVDYVYQAGDYTKELTEQAKEHAMVNYIESGYTEYEDCNYKHLLNDYRDGVLTDYMTNLLATYGTDYKIVGEKVRHDSLTHALLARYEEQLYKMNDLSHEELITEATRLYIEDTVTRTFVLPEKTFVYESSKESDKDKFFDELDNLVNFNSEGEAIYDEPEEEEDDYYVSDYDDEAFIAKMTSGKIYKAWEMADAMVVDVQDLKDSDVNKVLSHVWKSKVDDGFFKVYLMYGGNLVDTKFRVEDLDCEEITDYILSLTKANVTC